jgi:hypothetical protein
VGWILEQLRDDPGPWFPERVDGSDAQPVPVDRDALYCGIAGIALRAAVVGPDRWFAVPEAVRV